MQAETNHFCDSKVLTVPRYKPPKSICVALNLVKSLEMETMMMLHGHLLKLSL